MLYRDTWMANRGGLDLRARAHWLAIDEMSRMITSPVSDFIFAGPAVAARCHDAPFAPRRIDMLVPPAAAAGLKSQRSAARLATRIARNLCPGTAPAPFARGRAGRSGPVVEIRPEGEDTFDLEIAIIAADPGDLPAPATDLQAVEAGFRVSRKSRLAGGADCLARLLKASALEDDDLLAAGFLSALIDSDDLAAAGPEMSEAVGSLTITGTGMERAAAGLMSAADAAYFAEDGEGDLYADALSWAIDDLRERLRSETGMELVS